MSNITYLNSDVSDFSGLDMADATPLDASEFADPSAVTLDDDNSDRYAVHLYRHRQPNFDQVYGCTQAAIRQAWIRLDRPALADLAKRSGIPRSTLHRIIHNKTSEDCSVSNLVKACRAVGIREISIVLG